MLREDANFCTYCGESF
ncbi:MAG: hypothetical protein EAX91_11980 [Candidatus Lokiarchaeota archaeon]|nr:hypothetical protein [Candidatus Lokiarchaeota archaeon]